MSTMSTATILAFDAEHKQIRANMQLSDNEYRNLHTTDGQAGLADYITMAALRWATRDYAGPYAMLATAIAAYRAVADAPRASMQARTAVAAWKTAAEQLADAIGASPAAVELASITGADEGFATACAELHI